MKIKDIRIGTQLWTGLGFILAFVLLLSLLSWHQTEQLWLQTKSLYDHPLQVTAATGRLKTDISSFRMKVRDLLLAEDDREIAAHFKEMENYRTNISRQVGLIFDRSIGPRENLAGLQDNLAKWNAYQDDNIRLFQAGKIQEVISRIKVSNVAGVTEGLMASIGKLDDFSEKMSAEFYRQAAEKNETLNRQLVTFTLTIMILSVLVSFLLLKNTKTPLQQLTVAAEQFRRGEPGARSRYVSKNEFGVLSAAFNTMADTVETQMRIKERAARIADVMLREVDSRSFCRELLRELIDQTGSRIGAIYLLNPQKTEFELFESIGLAEGCRGAFSAVAPEGEFGIALASKKMQRILDIPGDTRFVFAATSGSFLPREIITLPLSGGQETVAVISLASLNGYDHEAISLLESVLSTLIARMNGVLAFRQIRELAEQLDQQNLELKAQKHELATQTDELAFQNSELVMQKRELDTANRLKSTFLSNMSHELRTPLNSVIALSSVLGRRLRSTISEEELGYLEVIERNGKNLLELINGILDLSRIESGREEVNPTGFSLKELIDEIVEVMNPLVREKGIALINKVGSGLPPIISDAVKVRQICQNLLANAVKFTESGSVSISARLEGDEDEVHIAIRDTGIGIAAEHLAHIFEEFRQADEGTSRKYGGTGLGLAISRKLALLLQGDIQVKSTVGEGSVFTLRLPSSSSSPDAEAEGWSTCDSRLDRKAASHKATAGNGECLLVVEDSEPAAIQLIDILSEQGYRVQVAQNGREALLKINEYPPAAVILDLMMPEVDGFEVLRQIRSSEKTSTLPVLILTAKHVSKEELHFLTGNHIHQLIQKGDIGKDELLAAVAEMIRDNAEPAGLSPIITSAGASTIMNSDGDLPLVLVVEDNPDNLLTVRAILEDIFRIETAGNGLEALSQARRRRPDLILMDLALPLMDGFTALEEIRKDRDLTRIPVLALTASAMNGDRENILARGFDGYISKPIERMEFRKILHQVLYASKAFDNTCD